MLTTRAPWIPEEPPALEGPDYVALVIEWEDPDTQVTSTPGELKLPKALLQVAGTVAGAVGAIALAAWGIHKLRS
ncbi:MAG: hypothetical protein JNL83_12490 [Myxococcales bacterium]|nr:hypothetical protein [Myxococcales bacterium]